MPLSKRRQTVQPIASINLTSLLDVTFVLLLAFMIVAPTLKSGLQMDLPKVVEPQTLTVRKSFTISLRLMKDSPTPVWTYFEGSRVDMDQLRKEMEQRHLAHGSDLDILIEADRLVPCENLFKVFATAKDVGIESVAVITEREQEK